MTISELKAFLDGMEVGIAGNTPTKDQWDALKSAVSSVEPPIAPTPPVVTSEPGTTQEA